MIKFVIFDFDGVFTDGKVTFDNNGNILKSYNIKDGMGINNLIKNNIIVGVISGYKINNSQQEILKHLNIKYISFKTEDKLKKIKEWCKSEDLELVNVAYMGDDINDIAIMDNIILSGCPKDSHNKVLNISKFISSKKGGQGCVREFCDYILENQINLSVIDEIKNECLHQLNSICCNDIYKLTEKILEVSKTNNIYFTGIGKSENIAIHTNNLLKSLGVRCFYLNTLNCTHGDIGTLSENDLIILYSKSGNTTELINIIPNLRIKKVTIYGVCCNQESKFKDLCDNLIVLPFKNEIDCNINLIPTNSYMSFLFFTNILVSKLSENINLKYYKTNHPAGNIGSKLITIKDKLIKDFPKIIIKNKEEQIELIKILLEMTKYKIGCCFFISENNTLKGILTDGDIRRIMLNNINKKFIKLEDINQNFYYESDLNKFIDNIDKKYKYVPIIEDNKLIGVFRLE